MLVLAALVPLAVSLNTPPVNIRVFGIGGGGGNAVNRMVEALGAVDGEGDGVDFVACNTDVQALDASLAANAIQLGESCTRGLGAGGMPEVGCEAAMESMDTIRTFVEGRDMVFAVSRGASRTLTESKTTS